MSDGSNPLRAPDCAPRLIVVDGHDGSGKSTLAGLLAAELGGRHLRPFRDAVAQRFVELVQRERFDELDRYTRAVVERDAAEHREARCLVFDRHWLTLYSLLPEDLFGNWTPLPTTVMCWADPPTTLARVSARGETSRNSLAYHTRYCRVFRQLAERFAVPLIDTTASTPRRALQEALDALATAREAR